MTFRKHLGALTLLLATVGGSLVAAETISWRTDVSRALREARKAERPVLIDVRADWCEACQQMESGPLSDPRVVAALEGIDTVVVDGDLDPEFVRQRRVGGYPTLLLLDGRGREVARQTGYMDTDGVLALLRALDAEAPAECSVSGRIRLRDGSPADAELTLTPSGAATRSGADGFYCFRGVATGTHEMLVVAAQHGTQRIALQIVGDGAPVQQDVTLMPSRDETVVVTGTRTAKLLRDAPVRTEVVSRERIEQSQSRTLADAVEFTPGVRVESNCQSCNFSQVRMLGLEGSYSQILIDGQAQWSPLSMVYGIEQIPTRMIDNVEIVKGGGSTIYGPGAVGGVINVRPRVSSRTGGTVEARREWMAGEPGHSVNGALDWVSADRDSFASLILQNDSVAPLDLSGDGFTEIAARELRSTTARLEHRVLEGRGRLNADLGFYDAERRGGNRLDLPPEQADLAEWIRTDRRSLALRWTHEPSPQLGYLLAASYVETDRDTYYGAEMDPDAFGRSENPLLLLDAQLNHRTGAHTLTWGVQYNADSILDEQPAIDRRLDEQYRNLGVFVQDDWTPGQKLSLVYGLRVDRHSEIADPIVSPRAALRLAPRGDLTLRSSLSTGFRPPAVFDEDLHIELAGGSQRYVVLDPNLKEESSVSLMQGVEWLPRRGEAFWLVEANAFYTGIRDIFEEEQIAPNEFVKTNAGTARVYGIELGLGYDLPRLFTVELGWVSQRSRFDEPEADFGSRDFFRTPEEYGVLNFTLRNARLGQAFLAARYTGSMKVPRYFFDDQGNPTGQALEESESFLTLDASVARRLRLSRRGAAFWLTLGVRNLTDAYQEDIDQGLYRDSDYVYGPRYPRSFYVTARFDF